MLRRYGHVFRKDENSGGSDVALRFECLGLMHCKASFGMHWPHLGCFMPCLSLRWCILILALNFVTCPVSYLEWNYVPWIASKSPKQKNLRDHVMESVYLLFEAQCRLCHVSSSSLVICCTWLSAVSDRAFPVAVARIWNSLPQHVTSTQLLPVFCSRLKTHLFMRCFP